MMKVTTEGGQTEFRKVMKIMSISATTEEISDKLALKSEKVPFDYH